MKPTKLETAAPLTLASPHRMGRGWPKAGRGESGTLTLGGYFCDMALEQRLRRSKCYGIRDSGKVILNVVPLLTSLSTLIRPWCS